MEVSAEDRALAVKIRHVVVERLHYTYTVVDFDLFREDFRYIYSHTDGARILPLIWRDQSTQANMVTVDASHRNLVYLPSARVNSIALALANKFEDELAGSTLPTDIPKLEELLNRLQIAVGFGPSPGEPGMTEQLVYELSRIQFVGEGWRKKLERVTSFYQALDTSYLPFVQLDSPTIDSMVLIHHAVDTLTPATSVPFERRLWRDKIRFVLTGKIHFDVPLPLLSIQAAPWEATNSVHVRVNLPEGLQCDGAPSGLPEAAFEGTDILSPHRTSTSERGIYAYLSSRTIGILRLQHSAATDKEISRAVLSKEFSHKSRRAIDRVVKLIKELSKGPKIRVHSKVAVGTVLIAVLLWVVVGIDLIWNWTSQFDFSTYGILLSALILVLLSGAVSVMDKPLPRYMMSWQASLGTTAFLAIPTIKWAMPLLREAFRAVAAHLH